jgi:hypothetical protein
MHQLDRLGTRYIKLVGGQEYPYIEVSVTQQESLYGFYIEFVANSVLLATTTTSLLFGFDAMDPVAETAANTLYDVNAGAAGKRIIGDATLDFTALLTNRIFIQPGGAIGLVNIPDVLLPVFGFYLKSDGLKLNRVTKVRGDI